MKHYTYTESPLGRMLMTADERALTGLYFVGQKYEAVPALDWIEDPRHPVLEQARRELTEYFAGERTQFDLPLAPSGTPFQRGVWRALEIIPSGTTTTYGELARSLGAPESIRAVGAAVGRNPISIIVPCHRVVGSTGSLTGYASGLERKRALLALEGSGSHAKQKVLL
ncbi:MAG TPA: methylated-DNA--[protein]-cysteine S-methyltransferase [Burkholderiales bacterium]|nr:methylated-DNA--[protein]-cysteine S-methyltransferase [Burkholderiales bacterium]